MGQQLLIGTYKMRHGMRQAFLKKAAVLAECFLKEEGCLGYQYLPVPEDPDGLVLIERWASAEDQRRHTKTKAFAELAAWKPDYVADTRLERFVPAEP